MFGAMRSEQRTHELNAASLQEVLRRTRAGFHRAVAGMAKAGNDIVMDHVLSEPWRLDDLLTVMAGIDVVCIGVHCAVDFHSHGIYDLEVDTSAATVETCSAQIREHLQRNPAIYTRAFDRLRARRECR
jgi:chloramphenicol 3-O phosphotransferase